MARYLALFTSLITIVTMSQSHAAPGDDHPLHGLQEINTMVYQRSDTAPSKCIINQDAVEREIKFLFANQSVKNYILRMGVNWPAGAKNSSPTLIIEPYFGFDAADQSCYGVVKAELFITVNANLPWDASSNHSARLPVWRGLDIVMSASESEFNKGIISAVDSQIKKFIGDWSGDR